MMELKIEIDGIGIDLQEYDNDKLEDLITELGDSHVHAKKHVCRDLYRIFLKREEVAFEIIMKNIIQLSRWCHTDDDGPYARGKSPAIKISKLLFKVILPRLSKDQFLSKNL